MRKIINFALALALALGLCIPASAAVTFSDVSGWAEAYILSAADKGLVNGTGAGKYSPESQVTYGQFATMLVNIKWQGELDAAKANGYDSAWWEPYCYVFYAHGGFNGTEMCDYLGWDDCADTPVDRANMALMVYNFMLANGGREISAAELAVTKSRINDIGNLTSGEANAIAYCYANGILNGVGNGRFAPEGLMTRAQAAVVLVNVFDILHGNTKVPTPAPSKPAGAIGGQYDTSKYSVPADANKDGWITEAEVRARIEELKAQYKPGTLWNDASVWGTDRNSADGYINSSGLHYYRSSTIGAGTGCAAWAKLLSDRIFGNLPWREFTDVYAIQPGDIIANMTAPHWMVYTRTDPDSSKYMRATCSPTSL